MNSFGYEPVTYDDVPGWRGDRLEQSLAAFADCLPALTADFSQESDNSLLASLVRAAQRAAELRAVGCSTDTAREFFETGFVPHRVRHEQSDGLLTGYFEPTLFGSRRKRATYSVPLYRRPDDLVDAIGDVLRASGGQNMTHARKMGPGLVAYPDRSEIENGALSGRNLEILYLQDAVDAFFLHVQGSGKIALDDGTAIRVGYDGKNGHPYTSIGKQLVAIGEMSASEVTLASLDHWLRQDAVRGRNLMQSNKSFIFFKELGPAENTRTQGVRETPLTATRSMAVDARYHRIGLPLFVVSAALKHGIDCSSDSAGSGFYRLMIAQDVGSAISGPERGDIFFGSGRQARCMAGTTKHRGNFFVLLPSDWRA